MATPQSVMVLRAGLSGGVSQNSPLISSRGTHNHQGMPSGHASATDARNGMILLQHILINKNQRIPTKISSEITKIYHLTSAENTYYLSLPRPPLYHLTQSSACP